MPSIRVKTGYQPLERPPPDGRGRTSSFAALFRPASASDTPQQSEPKSTTLRHAKSWNPDAALQSQDASRPPLQRPRASSKVSTHIMSTTRQSRTPRINPPETPLAGPSTQPESEEGTAGAGGSSLLLPQAYLRRRPYPDSYTLQGQQADLRIPTDEGRGLEGSQVNLALERLEDNYESNNDPLDTHHHDDIVEHLDVIDPQISTVSTLTNAANTIVVPPLSFYSRKPVVVLPRARRKKQRPAEDLEKGKVQEEEHSDEDALDQHVEDVLRKRDKFRRIMRGVWSFVKTPLGFITAIYGFMVVFWGTGIVFFLAKFINLHNDITQGFWVELCQQVETGLFTATSIGFIPFRIMDTYRVVKIWRYKRLIAKRRAKAGLPELFDPDDLPDPIYDPNYVHVLTEKEQIDLHYQQHQFMKSQTWYRPHGTQTHRAFPIDLALWICICSDLNSFFQILLSGTMWGLNRFARPAWTTGTTLPAAFVAGIVAGVLIYWGGKKTRRTEQVEDRLRTALEMERAEGSASAPADSGDREGEGGSTTATVEEASEVPERMPRVVEEKSPVGVHEDAGEAEKGTWTRTDVEDGVIRRDAAQGMDPARTRPQAAAPASVDATASTRSVHIVEEMTVPPAEEIHPRQGPVS